MTIRSAIPTEASELLEGEEGWICLDVRCVEEFEAGHPAGALNIPLGLLDPTGRGLQANPEFLEAVKQRFPTDARLVLSCAAGVRSMHACQALEAEGYTELVNMHGGFGGAGDMMGGISQPGWQALDLPVDSGAPAGRSWEELRPAP